MGWRLMQLIFLRQINVGSFKRKSFVTKNLSIIIPYFRGARTASQLVLCLKSQTYQDFDVIIVDDGQGVGFCELYNALVDASFLHRVSLVSTIRNLGPAGARNLALSMVNTRFVAFLDADDEWRDDYLEKMVTMQSITNAKFLVSQVIWREVGRQTELILPAKLDYYFILQTCPIQVPATLLDLSALGAISFPERGHEDYALWLLILEKGVDVTCVQESLVYINRTDGSVSANKVRASYWHWSILRDNINISLSLRFLLFLLYFLNALMKRRVKKYKPIFVSSRTIRKLVRNLRR